MDGDTERINALIQMAQKRKASEPIIALAISNIAIKELQRRKELKSQAELYLIKAQIFENLGFHSLALANCFTSLGISKTYDLYELQAKDYRIIGDIYSDLSLHSNSLYFNKKCIEISKKNRFLNTYASGLNSLGINFRLLGNSDSALKYFLNSMEIKKRIGEKKNLIISYCLIGIEFNIRGDYVKSLEYYAKGLNLSYQINDLRGMALCSQHIGEIFLDLKDFQRAKKYLYRCNLIYLKIKEKQGIAKSYTLLGTLHNSLGNSAKGFEFFNKALKEYRTLSNYYHETSLYMYIVQHYLNKNNADSSMFFTNKAFQYDKKYNNVINLIDDYITFSRIYILKNELAKASSYLDTSYLLLCKRPNLHLERDFYDSKYYLLEKQEHYKEALICFNNLIRLKSSIINRDKKSEIALKEIKIDYDRKFFSDSIKYLNLLRNRDFQILTYSNQIYAQTIKQYVLLGILIGLLIITYILILSYKSFRKLIVSERKLMQNEKQWSIVEERKKIAAYMHEDVGSALTNLLFQIRIKEWKQRDLIQNNLVSMRNTTFDLIDKIDQIVWSLNLQKDTLRGLISFLSTYFHETLTDFQIYPKTDISIDLPDVPINPDLRKDILLAVKESINNALKHAKASEMIFKVNFKDPYLVLTVKDNGCGFDSTLLHAGNGIRTRKKRVEKHNGKLEISSSKGNGTQVILYFEIQK